METTIVIIVMVDKYEATQDRLEMFGIKEKKAMINFIKKEVQIKEIVMETNIEINCYHKTHKYQKKMIHFMLFYIQHMTIIKLNMKMNKFHICLILIIF